MRLTGALSMNHIHREAGGPNGGQCSMNDSDIRALAQTSSGEISFSDTRGGATLTQGSSGTSLFGFSNGTHGGGVSAFGSITKISKVGPSGADIEACMYQKITTTIKGVTSTDHYFVVRLAGNRTSSFFTSFFESSLGTLNTSSATHSYNSQYNYTNWTWTLFSGPANFDGSGALKVKFA